MMGLGDLSISPGSNPAVPLQEGLFQQQHREKTLLEQHWERLGFPQKKKAFLGHFRRRHRDHMAPYPVERETRISFPGDRAQNQFRCQCRYCQGHMPNISGVTGERNGNPSPSSWETLVQGLSGLTLSLGTNRPGIQPESCDVHPPSQGPEISSEPKPICIVSVSF
ncbi:Protein FAM156A [Heterocephalus glaber]|nr:Protein FAM156A [Heterocephalus glaber]